MRVATFEAGSGKNQIQIVVSAFPGQAGGLLANVNRWRGQLHLEPLAKTDLPDHLAPFPDGPSQGFNLDMIGGKPDTQDQPRQRIVGAIIKSSDGMTWFVKAMDQPNALDLHKKTIVKFAQSFHVAGDGHSDEHVD